MYSIIEGPNIAKYCRLTVAHGVAGVNFCTPQKYLQQVFSLHCYTADSSYRLLEMLEITAAIHTLIVFVTDGKAIFFIISGNTSKLDAYTWSSILRCCPVTQTMVLNSNGYRLNSLTSGAILIASGRIPKTGMIFFIYNCFVINKKTNFNKCI